MHLLDRIARWGDETPARPAHLSGERVLTYAELCARSDILAAQLQRESADRRNPIAVLGHKEPEMLIAFLATVKSGRPYVPIDNTLPPQRIARIVAVAGATVTLTPASIGTLLAGEPSRPTGNRVEGDAPFYIIFTSGSTGEPKGVVITLANLTSFVDWMVNEQRFAEGDEVFLNQAPFSFDLSVMDLYLSLVTGGTLFSISKDDIANLKTLYAKLGRSGVTTWVSTPSFAQMCLIERGFNQSMLPRLRRFLFCGESLAPETAAQLLDRFPQAEVWNTYGPTEATVATSSIRIDREIIARHSPLPIGRAMPGTQLLVCDQDGAPLPAGQRGELVIAGPNVSPGYWHRPELTGRAFSLRGGVRSYRTGDWAEERDGLFFCQGRMDGQIKLFGFRIELGDLETNLRALVEIADAAVLPVEKAGKVESLAAFVILAIEKFGSDFEMSVHLKKQLSERLPAHMLPRKFHFLDAFPMTANGKVDRRALSEQI
ncbi:MAG: D-alanine--poly(phosphoribitol) ligase subunit DltA [Chthoniobacteraceae bacterium]